MIKISLCVDADIDDVSATDLDDTLHEALEAKGYKHVAHPKKHYSVHVHNMNPKKGVVAIGSAETMEL